MTISERHFSCPILSCLNRQSLSIYSTQFYTFYQLKVRFRTDNSCSFCKGESETIIRHFFWDCPYSNSFWKCVESYYFGLRKQLVHLTLKEIWIGFLTSECPLLNYLILIGKIYLWSCRRNEVLPTINSFIVRVNSKYEIEKYICTKNKSLQKLMDKWTL